MITTAALGQTPTLEERVEDLEEAVESLEGTEALDAARRLTWIDVTAPPAPLTAVVPEDTTSDAPELNAIIEYVRVSGQQAVIFMPPSKHATNTYQIDEGETWTIGGVDGLKIIGGGLGRGGGGSATDAMTRILCKGVTGPRVVLDDIDGLVIDGLTFDADSTSLDILVKHINGDGSAGSLGFHMINCGFWDAQTLWYNGDGEGSPGAADGKFSNCSWRALHNNDSRTRYAFYVTSEQNVHFTFWHNYFLQLGTVFHFEWGGRLSVYGCQAINCAQLIYRGNGGAGNAGFVVRDLFIDAQDTKRMIWLSTEENTTGSTYGPFIFENIAMHGSYPIGGTNFAQVASWPGTTLNLSGVLDIRPGDRIKFYDENDHDVVLAETTVVARLSVDKGTGTSSYQVSDTCCDLAGLPSDLTTVDAAHGESLFELHGGESVVVRNCWFRDDVVRGKRLATLRYGTGVRPSWVFFDNCIGWSNAEEAADLFTNYIDDLSGANPSYYRFRDCHKISGEPWSTTNIP